MIKSALPFRILLIITFSVWLLTAIYYYPRVFAWIQSRRLIVPAEPLHNVTAPETLVQKARDHWREWDCARPWHVNCNPAVLVTGPPRSGTTIVGLILSLGTLATYIHEPFNLDADPPCGEPRSVQMLTQHPRPPVTNETAHWIESFMHGECHKEICARHVILKDPVALFFADYLFRNYPLKVIMKLRHPGAIYVSRLKLLYGNPQEVITDVVIELREIMELYDSFATDLNWLWIKHEDFCLEPLQSIRRMYAFALLPLTQEILDDIQMLTSPENPENAHGFGVIFLNSRKTIDHWKHEIRPEHVEPLMDATRFYWEAFYDNESWANITSDEVTD